MVFSPGTGARCAGRLRARRRRGAIAILAVVMLVLVMALLALSIDTGYLYTMRTRLDRSVDAAALAGTSVLIDGELAAQDMVVEYMARNPLSGGRPIDTEVTIEDIKTQWMADHEEELQLTYGYWNPQKRELEWAFDPSAVKVVVARADVPLFFAKVLGTDRVTIESAAVATYKPRDIMVVLDLSASMNDDSELRSISSLGRDSVEENLSLIYDQLGQPVYGSLGFVPQFATVMGQPPATESLTQISVEYQGSSLRIQSTAEISRVVMELADGAVREEADFEAGIQDVTVSAEQQIMRACIESGDNAAFWPETAGFGEPFDFSQEETFVTAWGLDQVPYPYPSGSWTAYVQEVMTQSNANANAGYRFQFGYLNLINYWLERQPAHDQTPDLCNVAAQPLATVKEAVSLFVDCVGEVNTQDRIGLAVYNSASGEGMVEVPLTMSLSESDEATQGCQAGHYHAMTNVGGGLAAAINELQQHGRDGSFKMIILLTDGAANFVSGTNDSAAAAAYAVSEATRAHQEKYKVMTISLGLGADTNLMREVAEISEGIHFNIPGGGTINETRDGLVNAFREIARRRPVMLVK